jgi:hypothetical protein
LELASNARKVAAGRMAFAASTGAIEIPHPSVGVSRLEIGDVNGASPTFLCFRLPIMDECNYCR